jgi:hypothetical protein
VVERESAGRDEGMVALGEPEDPVAPEGPELREASAQAVMVSATATTDTRPADLRHPCRHQITRTPALCPQRSGLLSPAVPRQYGRRALPDP